MMVTPTNICLAAVIHAVRTLPETDPQVAGFHQIMEWSESTDLAAAKLLLRDQEVVATIERGFKLHKGQLTARFYSWLSAAPVVTRLERTRPSIDIPYERVMNGQTKAEQEAKAIMLCEAVIALGILFGELTPSEAQDLLVETDPRARRAAKPIADEAISAAMRRT